MAFDYTTPIFQEFWDRPQTFSTTPGFNGWTTKKTGSGTPTWVISSNRLMTMTLAADSEAQVAVLYFNDVLPWALGEITWIEYLIKVSGIDSVTTLVAGLASAQNDTADSTNYNAWFRMQGSASLTNLVVETDDATNNNDDIATGETLSSSFKRLRIDFAAGLSNVRFYVNGERVGSATTFDMSDGATTQGLQPYFQIQKASGTGTPAVTLGPVRVKRAYSY
jgi:hypothetical protein